MTKLEKVCTESRKLELYLNTIRAYAMGAMSCLAGDDGTYITLSDMLDYIDDADTGLCKLQSAIDELVKVGVDEK